MATRAPAPPVDDASASMKNDASASMKNDASASMKNDASASMNDDADALFVIDDSAYAFDDISFGFDGGSRSIDPPESASECDEHAAPVEGKGRDDAAPLHASYAHGERADTSVADQDCATVGSSDAEITEAASADTASTVGPSVDAASADAPSALAPRALAPSAVADVTDPDLADATRWSLATTNAERVDAHPVNADVARPETATEGAVDVTIPDDAFDSPAELMLDAELSSFRLSPEETPVRPTPIPGIDGLLAAGPDDVESTVSRWETDTATPDFAQGEADLQEFAARAESRDHAASVLEMVARRVRGGDIVPLIDAGASQEAVLASVLASILSQRA